MVRGDSEELLRLLGPVDHVITDPPYSRHVHAAQRRLLPDATTMRARGHRNLDLGFTHLDPALRWLAARETARIVARWVLVFADEEGGAGWRESLSHYDLDYVRTLCWDRDNTGTPQLTGDRPAVGHEVVVTAHPTGRKRWNARGKRGIYRHSIVNNYGDNGKLEDGRRVHTTQKPLSLMLELLADFTDPDDLILDPFAGSGTTGIAALRLGRRAILIERDPKYAAIAIQRMRAEEESSTLQARDVGQRALFGAT